MVLQLVEMEDNSLTTERIPATLMQKYLGKGHHFYHDNYYTSIPLAQYFLQNDTYVTGTIRETRNHFPPELKRVALNRGGSSHFEHDVIIVMKFRAHQDRLSGKTKVVHLLMTAHKPLQANTNKSDRDGIIIQSQAVFQIMITTWGSRYVGSTTEWY